MATTDSQPLRDVLSQRTSLLLLVLLAALVTLGLAACGSSEPASDAASPSPVKTGIIKLLPRDAAVEPPWNGRFVQVNVRVADPKGMDPADWHVYVNGKEPDLDKEPSILAYAPHEAIVAFVFQAPYGDSGTYDFRVVYAPEDAAKVQKSWEYAW